MAPTPIQVSSGDGPDAGWSPPRLNRGTVFVLGAINLTDCISICLLLPYVDRMVSSFLGRPTDDPSVVQTVGLLTGCYSLCEVMFSPFWGYLADRIGRRPILLIGLAGSALAPVLFGTSQSLHMAFLWRCLDGFFCGNVGVTKTYLGEIVDRSNEARGFSFLAVCFSLGMVIGPLLGGQLAEPASWAPHLFAGTFLERFPYLLPNLSYSCFAAVAWVLGFFYLEETLPPSARSCSRSRPSRPQAAALLHADASSQAAPSAWAVAPAPGRPACPRSVWMLIFAYCLLTGYYAAWQQNIVLILQLPTKVKGFGFGPHEIGILQNVSAFGIFSTQMLFYPRFTKRFGYLACFAGGCIVNLAVSVLFPIYGLMADPQRFGEWRFLPLSVMMFFGQSAAGFCFPTMFLWFNRSLEGLDKGTWNGTFNSLGALCRAFFPPTADALLSFGLRHSASLGRYLPVYVNSLVGLGSLALAVVATRVSERDQARRKGTSSQPTSGGTNEVEVA